MKFTEADIVHFATFVEKLPNGCHFWSGARSRGKGNKKWYGSFRVPSTKKVIRAHRFACEAIGKRECPPEHHRDHTCEFSLCVNEAHIEVVTRQVNQERKVARRKAREKDLRGTFMCQSEIFNGPVCEKQCHLCKVEK